ncbi:MAG: TolC family protein, partial [Pseudomonadota bacterium]
MRSRQVIFAIAAVAVAPAMASGQSITDALALAYQNNGTLAAARAELRATDEGVPEAFGGFLPTLTADGDAGYERTRIRSRGTTDSRADGRPFGYSVTLEQPIFLGGRNFSQLSAAENSVLAQRAELADVEQSVLRSAASAFVDVAQAQSIVRLRENNVAVLERQLQATQDRFSVGEETRTDVAQSESRLAASRAELIAAQGDLSSSISTYVQVIG